MIIRMAKVEIVGPKQDLLNTLDLLHNRGIFQPDPQLLERVELALPTVCRRSSSMSTTCASAASSRISTTAYASLLELLPETANGISPLQPLPVMDLLAELVDQHLAKARETGRAS